MRRVCESESGDTPGPEYTSTWCAEGAGPGICVECRNFEGNPHQLLFMNEADRLRTSPI